MSDAFPDRPLSAKEGKQIVDAVAALTVGVVRLGTAVLMLSREGVDKEAVADVVEDYIKHAISALDGVQKLSSKLENPPDA